MDKSSDTLTSSAIRQNAQNYKAHGLAYLDELPRYCGISHVDKAGLSVDECACLVARFAAIKRQCVFIKAARMADTPELEVKAVLAKWMWEDATDYQRLEERLSELRSNKLAVDKVLDYHLGDFLCEILHSPATLPLFVGLFDVLTPAFCAGIRTYLAETQPLVDSPTIRLLKEILAEEEERLELGHQFVSVLAHQKDGEAVRRDWKDHFQRFLAAAGGILGRDRIGENSTRLIPRATEAYRAIHNFARDERFTVSYPKICPPEVAADPLLRTMWARSQELPVAETVAVILYEWDDLPTQGIVDLARQCWDETRHSLFGQVALEKAGITLPSVPSWVGFGVHALAESPQKGFAHLTLAIEAGLMAHPGGKRGEWEYCRDVAKDPLMTTFQDFDWADEITHVKYGRKWVIEHYFKGNREAARKLADDSIRDRVEYYAKFGFRDWMADRLNHKKPEDPTNLG